MKMQFLKKIFQTMVLQKGSVSDSSLATQAGYYQAAKDWYQEKYELITVSRNRYRVLAMGLGLLLALSFGAFIMLLPMKQYVYRLIEVNQQTGEVNALKEMEGNKYAGNWVITRYFIHQYVLNRHLYSHEDVKRTFNMTLAMSSKSIADDYSETIMDVNPESPLNILNTDYYREVNILGINQLNEKTALVRFKTITHHKTNKNDVKVEDLQAVVKWEFNNFPASLKDSDKNPLGFFVTYYKVTPVYLDSNS
jgi:type IV secretion system protein VirB8